MGSCPASQVGQSQTNIAARKAAHLSQHQIPIAVCDSTHWVLPMLEKVVVATPVPKTTHHKQSHAHAKTSPDTGTKTANQSLTVV
jgi:hypothetical protein